MARIERNRTGVLSMAAVGLTLLASPAGAQATLESAHLPQPHLAKAREDAFRFNNWRFPALIACYPDEGQPAQKIIKDPPAGKAADNLYFLGNGIVAAWAIDTPAGFILIDAMNNQAEVDKYIIGGMQALGLDPSRIKVILVSHGHGDHYGGARYLQDKYGAKVYSTDLDFALAERSAAAPNARTPAPRRDVVVADGDTVTLGDTTISLYITPGHTPGGLSMMIPIKDRGQVRTVAYLGGITSKNLTPANHQAFEQSVARFLTLSAERRVDGYIANHPSYDDAAMKLEHYKAYPNKPNPFLVGTEETLRFFRVVRECNLNNAEIEAAAAQSARTAAR